VFKVVVERRTTMSRHLEPAVILEHAVSMETGQQSSRKPVLSLAWSLDPQTGKPIARWIALSLPPSVVLEGE